MEKDVKQKVDKHIVVSKEQYEAMLKIKGQLTIDLGKEVSFKDVIDTLLSYYSNR